jgi:hypothetical protein
MAGEGWGMPPKSNDEERERPSWREIDQRRDGSRHRAQAPPPAPKAQAESIRKPALALTSPSLKIRRVAEEILAKFE